MSEDRKWDRDDQTDTEPQRDAARTPTGELTQDERFKTFFTTSVIEVPEQMLKVNKQEDSVEEPPEPRRGLGGWLRSLFGGTADDEDEEDAGDVLIPAQQRSAPEREPEREMEISLAVQEDEPPRRSAAPEPVPEPPQKKAPPVEYGAEEDFAQAFETAAGKEETAAVHDEPEAQIKPEPSAEPVLTVLHEEEEAPTAARTPAPAAAAKPQPAVPKPSRAVPPSAAVTVDQLLGIIDETQAELKPAGTRPSAAPAIAEAASAIPAAKPEAAELVQEIEQAIKPEKQTEEPAPAQEENAQAILPQEPHPEAAEEKAEPAETAEPEAPAQAEQTPAQRSAEMKAAMAAQIEHVIELSQTPPVTLAPNEAELADREPEAAQPEEPTGEVTLDGLAEEPNFADGGTTGEIVLESTDGAAEPAAETAPGAAGMTESGRILIDAAAEAAEAGNTAEGWELPHTGFLETARRALDGFMGRGGIPDTDNEDADAAAADTAPAAPAAQEYTDPEDAQKLRGQLAHDTARLTLRCALTGVLAGALLVLNLLGQGPRPIAMLDPAVDPALWLGLNFVLLALCAGLNWTTLRDGLTALLPRRTPTAAALPAVTVAAALLQAALCLILQKNASVPGVTIFAGAAALLLFADALGRRFAQKAVQDGFAQMTSGVETATAYRLQDKYLTADLCAGMDEDEPVLMLSRPSALLKNFLSKSAAPHRSDAQAVDFARVLGAVAVLCMVISLVMRKDIINSVSLMAGILCLGAPLSAMLVRAVPALLMQRAAGHVGAVVPGWPGIEQMGDVDMLQVDAEELFPPACAYLYGIKTIQKERIDRAILYATSILIEGCSTLSGLFRNMIENNTALLYPVKDLEKLPGLGFIAWCDSCRVLLGTREMMEAEGIALPARDYEDRYTQNGDRHLLYLAVSGKLCAMFLFGYHGTKKVARTLGVLRRENIRLLVRSDDPTLTAARIEEIYRLRAGFVKVLSQAECDRLAPATAYLPAMEGCMVHLPDFASMVGGLRAAAAAERAERSACTVQMVAVTVSILLSLLFTLSNSLYNTSMFYPMLYQIAWSAISVAITLTKMY